MFKFLLRILFIYLIMISIVSSSIFAALVLQNNFGCARTEFEIEVFLPDEFEERRDIQRELCQEGETPQNDFCREFTSLSNLEYTIFNGPLRGLGILDDGRISSSNTISFNPENSGDFLIEIKLDTDPVAYFQEIIEVIACSHLEEEAQEVVEPELQNLSFQLDSGIRVFLSATNLNETSDLELDLGVEMSQFINLPENSLQAFSIFYPSDLVFEKLTLNVPLPFMEIDGLEIYFSATGDQWIPFTQFDLLVESLEITVEEEGFFILVSNEEEEAIEEESFFLNPETTPTVQELRESGMNPLTIIVLGLLVFLIIISFFIFTSSNKNSGKKTSLMEETSALELVPSYRKELENARMYIKKYKDSYSKESLIKELRNVGYHEDVISKAIGKEYD